MKRLLVVPAILFASLLHPQASQAQVPNPFSSSVDVLNGAIGVDTSLDTPGGIISKYLPYVYVIAGLILLFMFITGGFEMLTAVSNPDKAEAGKKRITTALGGFLLLFAVYWIYQAVEVILGLDLLSSGGIGGGGGGSGF